MKCKNTMAMVLAGAMLLPSNAFAADLSQYRDFPNDWSAKSLEQAIDDGLLNGSNGMIDAKGLLTRAQMAAIVSRAFGAAKTASLDDYRDVLPSAWYYSDMGKAVKMASMMDVPVLGLVENMAYVTCPHCNEKIYPYGPSRLQETADHFDLVALGQLPIDPALAAACDAGSFEQSVPDGLLPEAVQTVIQVAELTAALAGRDA